MPSRPVTATMVKAIGRFGKFAGQQANANWTYACCQPYVGVMPEPGQEPRSRPSPGAMLSNWITYDAPLADKLRMAASNTLIKLRNHQGCCGHHGQPGC